MKTTVEYQQYFESEFEKKVQEFLKKENSNNEYSLEDARCDATAYFCNDCEDYDAVAGMYIGYASGDASKALEDFMIEIDDEEPTEYDKAVISRLEKIKDEIRFEKANGEYLVTTRRAIENALEGNYDNPDNPWTEASVNEVIEEAKDEADEYLMLYILADMLKDNGGVIESTLSIRGK